MNIQFQRMMVVLFLALTLIAVTVLFWLPVNNDSDRILVAKESPSTALLNLAAENREDSSSQLPSEELPSEELLGESEQPLDMELQGASPVHDDTAEAELHSDEDTASDVQTEDSASPNSEVAPPLSLAAKVAPKSTVYAYDVMGNKRAHVSDYTVRKDDWFSAITGKYWDDLFMWPDLYTLNTENLRSTDPDLIFPGEKIGIYDSLTADGEFSEDDRHTLLSAYLKVYKTYKQVGEGRDLAAAQLLASALRYDKNFLEKYSTMIVPEDRRAAQRLIEEQRFLD